MEIVKKSWEDMDGSEMVEKVKYSSLKLEECGGGVNQDYKRKLMECRIKLRKLRSRRDQNGGQCYNEVRWEYLN